MFFNLKCFNIFDFPWFKCTSALICEFYAERAEEILRPELITQEHAMAPLSGHKNLITFNPLGVVLIIMPWNFPFWQVNHHVKCCFSFGTSRKFHIDLGISPGCSSTRRRQHDAIKARIKRLWLCESNRGCYARGRICSRCIPKPSDFRRTSISSYFSLCS